MITLSSISACPPKGTLLAKINDAELTAQLNKSKVQLELATKTEQRLKKLLDISGINQADYDIALNNVNNIKADIVLLQAQIESGLRLTKKSSIFEYNDLYINNENYSVFYKKKELSRLEIGNLGNF